MGYEAKDDTYRLSVVQDSLPINPRVDWANLGIMACAHKRYELGDPDHQISDSPIERVQEIEEDESLLSLPLYLYDHSGIVMSTTPFRSRWDSGRVGIIYAEKGAEGLSAAKIKEVMRAEVDIYNAFLEGSVYHFTLYERYKCEECGEVQEEMLDSCGGFFMLDYDKEDLLSQIEGHLTQDSQYLVQELEEIR